MKNPLRITTKIRTKDVVETPKGPVKAEVWCEAEAARIVAHGGGAEVVVRGAFCWVERPSREVCIIDEARS